MEELYDISFESACTLINEPNCPLLSKATATKNPFVPGSKEALSKSTASLDKFPFSIRYEIISFSVA